MLQEDLNLSALSRVPQEQHQETVFSTSPTPPDHDQAQDQGQDQHQDQGMTLTDLDDYLTPDIIDQMCKGFLQHALKLIEKNILVQQKLLDVVHQAWVDKVLTWNDYMKEKKFLGV